MKIHDYRCSLCGVTLLTGAPQAPRDWKMWCARTAPRTGKIVVQRACNSDACQAEYGVVMRNLRTHGWVPPVPERRERIDGGHEGPVRTAIAGVRRGRRAAKASRSNTEGGSETIGPQNGAQQSWVK